MLQQLPFLVGNLGNRPKPKRIRRHSPARRGGMRVQALVSAPLIVRRASSCHRRTDRTTGAIDGMKYHCSELDAIHAKIFGMGHESIDRSISQSVDRPFVSVYEFNYVDRERRERMERVGDCLPEPEPSGILAGFRQLVILSKTQSWG